jgi:hypothetical protein
VGEKKEQHQLMVPSTLHFIHIYFNAFFIMVILYFLLSITLEKTDTYLVVHNYTMMQAL